MRWPIRHQILVPFTTTMLIALAAVSALNAYIAARQSAHQIERQLSDIALTMNDARFPLTPTVLAQMHRLSGADFILTDAGGGKLAASSPLLDRLELPTVTIGEPGQVLLESPIALDNERYFHTAVRISRRVTSEDAAVLHLLYPEQSWRQSQRAAALPALVVGGIALIAVTLLALLIAHRISRPIRQVRQQAGRLALADFQQIELPPYDDELRDLVTEMNRLAQQLDAMRLAIARGERLALLGQLSGGLAHHLRNDVTGAKLAMQLHQQNCPAGDHKSLAVALRQLALTEEHLKRFLAAGRPQALQTASCDLNRIVSDTRLLVEPALRHRRITLKADLQPIPELTADAEQLRHLLMNLILNAAEAAGPAGWISIETRPTENRTATLFVRDSGHGPKPEILDRLFQPFATDKPEGVGLGLTVALQIAEAHGGQLHYTRVDGATCFALRLPVAAQFSAGLPGEALAAPLPPIAAAISTRPTVTAL